MNARSAMATAGIGNLDQGMAAAGAAVAVESNRA